MKEVPKQDEPEISGGVVSDTRFRNGLVIPGYPIDPCIPMPEDPIKNLEK